MNNSRSKILLAGLMAIFAMIITPNVIRANIPVGHWRHHLPGNSIIRIDESPSAIIGATPYALVLFNKADNSIEQINKVQGLSDFDITTIAYAESHNAIIAAYENGNIDIIINNSIVNITDIVQASIIGSKRINRIIFDGDRALLACDFGIVDMNLNDKLIYGTWQIGPHGSIVSVYDLLLADGVIYAATNAGILWAYMDAPNLSDYRNWESANVTGNPSDVFHMLAQLGQKIFAVQKSNGGNALFFLEHGAWQPFVLPDHINMDIVNGMRASQGKLIIAHDNQLTIFNEALQLLEVVDHYFPGTVTPNDALYDSNQGLWVADRRHGLVRQHGQQTYEKIVMQGPPYANAFGLAHAGGRLWVAPGSISYGGSNSWNRNGIFLQEGGRWTSFSRINFPEMADVADIIRVTTDPGNPNIAYASSWYGGMVVFDPEEGLTALYNDENSTLRKRTEHNDYLRVGGVAVDRQGNVWVTNSEVARPLSVKKPDGQWLSFTSGGTFGTQTRLGDIIIDNNDQKWVVLPSSGIFVFKEQTLNNTNSFDARRLTTQFNNGALPSNNVHSIALDHSGYVWVGTDEGVAVFYAPHQALSGDAFNAQRIIVQQDDGFAGYLLETETVNCIEVDGSNKKWFGTSRSGAFLLSPDGRETIFHFDKNNSPLPSNNILDITINGQTGEVYFATDRGLVSFRGFATEAANRHANNVYAYPNPVRPGYNGYIAVNGLVRNASVKITDISGNLVWETFAEGGQAIWNGQDLFGRRPSTGVYLVFSTNDNGEETMVTKIMFIQ